MATSKNSTRFTINFIEKQIIGTKASFDKAGKGFGPEYEELADKMAAHPRYTLVAKQQKKKITRAKHTYHGLDYKFMEDYIGIQKNSESLMKQYENAKQVAKATGRSVYPFTKHWFLDKFSDGEDGFDMETAQQAITAALTKKANIIGGIENADSSVNALLEKVENLNSSSTSVLAPAC